MKALLTVLAVFAVLGFSTPVWALDLSGLYVSGKLGVSFMSADDTSNTSNTNSSAGTTAGGTLATPSKTLARGTVMPLGGALGYNWEKLGLPVRTEVEYLYRTSFGSSANPSYTNAATPTQYSSTIYSQSLLMNAYYDVKIWKTIMPYIGGGLGASWNNVTTDSAATAPGSTWSRGRRSTQNFAWNVGAGVGYSITDHIILDVSYRYSDLGDVVAGEKSTSEQTSKMTANELLFGLRYQF